VARSAGPAGRVTSFFAERTPELARLGATQVLNPGDTYIQNGTRHRWSNTGDVPAVLAIAIVGAGHTEVG